MAAMKSIYEATNRANEATENAFQVLEIKNKKNLKILS